MKKVIKKSKQVSKHPRKKTSRFLVNFFLLGALFFTIVNLLHPQYLRQFAQYSEPPMFGCIHLGDADPTNCGTKLASAGTTALTMYGRPVTENTTVYYGDRITGNYKFTNEGDVPFQLTALGLVASAKQEFNVFMIPTITGNKTLKPQESVNGTGTYKFGWEASNGQWTLSTEEIDQKGSELNLDQQPHTFTVNATCTALRIKELTDKDKANLKSLCKNDPKNPLCTSRQYCEIFQGKGPNCTKPNVSEEKPKYQCDEWVLMDPPERDMLEQLCKVYPDSDACVRFCQRTLESPLCPKRYTWIDKKTGKEAVPQPKIIKEPQNNLATYKAASPQAVAGAEIAACNPNDPAQRAGGCAGPVIAKPAPPPPPPPPPAKPPAPPAPGKIAPAPATTPKKAPLPLKTTPVNCSLGGVGCAPPPKPACQPNMPVGCCHPNDPMCPTPKALLTYYTKADIDKNGKTCAFDAVKIPFTSAQIPPHGCIDRNTVGNGLEALEPAPGDFLKPIGKVIPDGFDAVKAGGKWVLKKIKQ